MTRTMKLYLAPTSAVLVVVSVLVAEPATAAEWPAEPASYSTQQRANALQRCLEQELAPLQIESSVSRDGRIEDVMRITRWRSANVADQYSGAIGTRCISSPVTTEGSCAPVEGIRHTIGVTLLIGDQHPSWSANDRARFEEGIIEALATLGSGIQIRDLRKSDSGRASHDDEALSLRVRINYLGSSLSPHALDAWLRMPQSATISMDLIDSAEDGHVIAARNVVAKAPIGYRSHLSPGVPHTWRQRVLSTVTSAARDMIEPLACALPALQVTLASNKLWLNTLGFTGLSAGRALLLVPSVDTSELSFWPIVKVRSATNAGMVELDIVRGDATTCTAGCRALPL